MLDRVMRCAAGLLVLAAASWPALAEESPIGFVSGPLAGVPASEAHYTEAKASDGSGTVRTNNASFETRQFFGYVEWSRLSGGRHWPDTDRLVSLSRWVEGVLKASGFTVEREDTTSVNGFRAQYRIISLAGSGERCGVFGLNRGSHLIKGTICSPDGQVPLLAVLQGLSIDGVIGP